MNLNEITHYIMGCRSVRDGITTGAKRFDEKGNHYQCAVCGELVSITPQGVARLRDNPKFIVMCNPCAFTAARVTQAAGTLAGVELNEAAVEQVLRAGNNTTFGRWLREQMKGGA